MRCKRFLLLILMLALFAGWAPASFAQGIGTNPQFGSLNVLDAGTCAVSSGSSANSFVVQQLPQNAGTSTVTLAGTFSVTATIRLSANGGTTWVTQGTQSSIGTTSYAVAGFNYICADITSFVSGSANVTINSSLASSGSNGTGAGFTNVIVAASSGVKADWFRVNSGANFTVTSGSPIVTCTTCHFQTNLLRSGLAAVGMQIFATNWGNVDNSALTAVAVITTASTTPVTIISVDSDTQIHISANATGNAGTTNANVGVLLYGDDDTAAWHTTKVAAYDAGVCGFIQAPPGYTNINVAEFLTKSCPTDFTNSAYPGIAGWTQSGTTFVIPPWFDYTTCNVSSTCFGNGSWRNIGFTGEGQDAIPAAAAGKLFFSTFNDMSYEDMIFSALGAGVASTTTCFTINSGYHIIINFTIDRCGNAAFNVIGNAHEVFGLFAGNSTDSASTGQFNVGSNQVLACFGCAFQFNFVGVFVNSGGTYWGYNDSNVLASGSASACWKTATGSIFARGGLCINAGNTGSVSVQVTGAGIAQVEQSKLGGGATSTAWACNAAATCDSGVGLNTYNANPIGNVGCNSAASPAVCAGNLSGTVAVAASGSTLTVNTTAVTANSIIVLTEDASLGTRLGVTCNVTPTVQPLTVTARSAGVSFTFSNTSPTTNPRCVNYEIKN